ncbi:hypothetical protein GFK91_06135 [Roseibium aggregatum]|uniref:hypothetical protein n=1 Tax=Roseibium aggregatum TaxID=187304 RepID=UPI001E4F17AE|nr:hypothetical protein [Roseibium aggregatum]UES55220.1 hypothetical protein GFK91_06135 [Roseibium aggregatum]
MAASTGCVAAFYKRVNDGKGPFLSFDLRSASSDQLPFKALGVVLLVHGSLRTETTPYGKWVTKIGGAVCAVLQTDMKIDRSDDGYGMRRSSPELRML